MNGAAVHVFFGKVFDQLSDILNYLRMSLVQHAEEHFDLLDIQMFVVPEHSLPHIVNEVHYALIDSI